MGDSLYPLGKQVAEGENNDLDFAGLTAFEHNGAFGDFELFSEKFHELFVGRSLHGGGFDADLDRIVTVQTGKLTAAGGGLSLDPESNNLSVNGKGHQEYLYNTPAFALITPNRFFESAQDKECDHNEDR
jgi:hypothetical protein